MILSHSRHYLRFGSRRAVSLIEVVVSSLLVGLLVVGALEMNGAAIRSRNLSSDMVKGPILAESLLAEIMSMPYDDPDTGSGANNTNTGELSVTRADFDDIGDYDDWSTTTVQDRLGNPIPGYSGWSRSVNINWGNRTNGDPWYLWDSDSKRIMVTVTSPSGTAITRFGWRSSEGMLEQTPSMDMNVISMIETAITLGPSSQTATGVANLLNQVEDPGG